MTTCAVLLRGINVGGANKVAMAELRALLESVGATKVVTYLQSGQAVLDADLDGLADRVEAALQERFGREIRVLVRTGPEIDTVIDENPYPHKVMTPKHLHAVFVERDPTPDDVQRVGGLRHGSDEFALGDRVIYVAYAAGSHDSPAAKAVAKLRSTGAQTARNWTTVLKLQELCSRP